MIYSTFKHKRTSSGSLFGPELLNAHTNNYATAILQNLKYKQYIPRVRYCEMHCLIRFHEKVVGIINPIAAGICLQLF